MAGRFFGKAGWAFVLVAALGAGGLLMREPLAGLLTRGAAAAESPDAAGKDARPAQPVRVTRVSLGALDGGAEFTGTLRPRHAAALAFRGPGQLVARLVEVGDRVVAGQVVARLDDTDARLELEAAAAERDAAAADLERARAEAARSRALFAAGHIAQAALDRTTTAEAEAASRADRALRAHDLAANRLSYTTLLAEADGVVTDTLAEPGQVLSAGAPVLAVAETGALDVVFALPENRRDLLTTAKASATLWEGGGTVYPLALRDVSPDVDPVGRTYRVRMTLAAPDGDTALGRTVTVHLQVEGGTPVVLLPLAAVLNDGAGPAVWRLPQGSDRVERVPVEMAGITGQLAQLRGPLVKGDIVVSLGAHKLDPARPVRVVETASSPES